MPGITKYAIRQKSTGWYIPKPLGRQGRGGSHTEPVAWGTRVNSYSKQTHEPRLFDTERAAKIFLKAWIQGKWNCYRSYDPEDGYEDIEIVKQPHRNLEDIEIVPIPIIFP